MFLDIVAKNAKIYYMKIYYNYKYLQGFWGMEGWEKRYFLHFTFNLSLQSVSGQYTQFNYYIKSREPAKNRPVLDDLLKTCKSYLVQAKVELLSGSSPGTKILSV